jgi:FG-GAP-like repeat
MMSRRSPIPDRDFFRHSPGRCRPGSALPAPYRGTTFRFRPLLEVLENRALLSTALAGSGLAGDRIKDRIHVDLGVHRLVDDDNTGHSILQGSQSWSLPSPGGGKLTDLNRDAIPDLIVAGGGSNNVLIYRGLGSGQFGPPIGGASGFPADTDAAGITAADLTGDRLPDLVIANKGSNDVQILLNQSQGDNLFFTTGQRLLAGSGPVSTVVDDFNGDGMPDILVNHSGLNQVTVFLGVGGGVFDDQHPAVFSLDSRPGSMSADQLSGPPDLAALDPGADRLTLISDFSRPDPMTSIYSAGGLDQVTVFVFLREGTLALFDGAPEGLSLMSAETGLLDPTALAFSALTGGHVQFYAAPAGGELAKLVALGLGIDTGLPLITAESANTMAQLVPLHESSLALVATVLAFATEAHRYELIVDPAQTDVTTGAAFLPGESVSVGQDLSQWARDNGAVRASGEETGDSTDAAANPGESSAMTWERFVIGLDEALEGFRREYQGPISGDHDQSRRDDQEVSQPQAGSSSPDEPTSWRSALEPFPGDVGREGNGSETPTREGGAIKATEASLPLVTAAMITGWSFIVRSSVPQSHFSAESPKKRLPPLWSLGKEMRN